MIQFIGLNFLGGRVHAAIVDQRARRVLGGSVPIPGLAAAAGKGVLEVPQQEWVRAGCLALQDAYFRLPVKIRRLWGLALAGPQGWIAIDPDLDPISPLRLTPGESPLPDFLAWLAENPRERRHIFAVLSPKDYFRFRVSGALAADATQASQTGLLLEGKSYWSPEAIAERGLIAAWLPPVFDSAFATGRLSAAGIELTGIPDGLWVVAGADSAAAAEVAAHDSREGKLLALIEEGAVELRLGIDGSERSPPAAGWQRVRASLPGRQSLTRRARVEPGAALDLAFIRDELLRALQALAGVEPAIAGVVLDGREPLPEWTVELAGALPLPVVPALFAGEPDPGTALLAGMAKGAFRDADDLYRKLRAARLDADRDPAPEAAAGGAAQSSPTPSAG